MFDNIEEYIKKFNKLTDIRIKLSAIFAFISVCACVFIYRNPSKSVIPIDILCAIQIIVLETICSLSDLYLENIKSDINYNDNETYITNPYNEFITYSGAIKSIRDAFTEKYIAYLFSVNTASTVAISLSAIPIICGSSDSLFKLCVMCLPFIVLIRAFYKDGIKVIDNYEKILKFTEDKNNE